MSRRPKTIAFWTGRLPHWEVEDGRYFITIHLAGAIPLQGRSQIRAISEQLANITDRNSPKWLEIQRSIFASMERWLDLAKWNPHFASAEVAQMACEAIEHRHRAGDWHLFEYVVMPTHVHLFCEIGRKGLKVVLEDFKPWTSHRAAELLQVGPACRAGPENSIVPRSKNGTYRFWQREWFDHWSRSDEEDDRTIAYIRNNPEKAQLVTHHREYPYASWSRPL
jgi:putative transposase